MSRRRAVRTTPAAAMPVPRLTWAYLFDIDGTLVDIAPDPDAVRVNASVRAIVDQLYVDTGGAVALVSGRTIRDIDRMYPRCAIPLSALHGVESRDAGGVTRSLAVDGRVLEHARKRMADGVARHAGLVLEDKEYALALHYRAVPRLAGYAHSLLRVIQAECGEAFVVQKGKRVVELRLAATDKGVAIVQLMSEAPFAGRTPVFVGDDLTDEYAFAAVNRLGGYSVKIGQGATQAEWRLHDVGELMAWLRRAQ